MAKSRRFFFGLGRLLRQLLRGRAALNDRAWTLNPLFLSMGRFLSMLRKRLIIMRQASIRISINAAKLQAHTDQCEATAQEQAREAQGLSAQGTQIAGLSQETNETVSTAAAVFREQLQGLQSTEKKLDDLRQRVDQVTRQMHTFADEVVAQLSSRARSVEDTTHLIKDIATQTHLLALNARVEAARAGEAGSSFAVVASEVGKLADRVNSATGDIEGHTGKILSLVDDSEAQSREIYTNLDVSDQLVGDFSGQFHDLLRELNAVGSQLDGAVDNVAQVSQTNQDMSAAITRIAEHSNDLQDRMQAMRGQVQGVRGETESLQEKLAAWKTGSTAFDGLVETLDLLRGDCIGLLRKAKSQGMDVFDQRYTQIADSNPPRYHVAYDQTIEQALQKTLDGRLKQAVPHGYYAILVDANGYAPTHNSHYSHTPTGDVAYDTLNCRDKRVFDDRIGAAAASNQKGVLCQTYMRDTGEIISDVSVPLDLGGKHWGAIRIGLDYQKYEQAYDAANGKQSDVAAEQGPAALLPG